MHQTDRSSQDGLYWKCSSLQLATETTGLRYIKAKLNILCTRIQEEKEKFSRETSLGQELNEDQGVTPMYQAAHELQVKQIFHI